MSRTAASLLFLFNCLFLHFMFLQQQQIAMCFFLKRRQKFPFISIYLPFTYFTTPQITQQIKVRVFDPFCRLYVCFPVFFFCF
uniref:Putative secreted protein n=1 Tax=Lutzomyia longipalpis TaxID=7200 RepID=A0A7G3AHD6_LUTLO